MGSFFLASKKASVTIVFLVVSILVVSSGVIIVNEVEKSNNKNKVVGTGLVLLDNEQDNSQYSDSSDDEIKFTFGDSGRKTSSKKSSGGGGGASSSALEIDEEARDISVINETGDNQNETNYTGEINAKGACKQNSKETNEGPGGDYCLYDDYEQCYDYRTKSTVIAYDCELWPPGCFEYERDTDYCSDSNTLQEAYLNCGFTVLTADRVRWKEKDCNDYDGISIWTHYCTSTQVRKHRIDYDGYCSDGECRVNSQWRDDQLVSQKGDSDYCDMRKEGYDNDWEDCSLCGHGDYDCDSNNECAENLECMGPWPDPPFGGDWDGCCKSEESWDSTNNRCCECDDASDPCCDGCHYKSSSSICDYHYGNYYYDCPSGQCLGDDVKKQDRKRYCSGDSSSCDGAFEWNDWLVHDSCSSGEFCDSSNAGYNTPFSCSTAQCTSGLCCDTDCGEYSFLSSINACAFSFDYGCPDGEGTSNSGADVYVRMSKIYCSGESSSCDGSQGSWGDWSLYASCTSDEYCVQGDDYCHSCGDCTYDGCYDDDVYCYDDCDNREEKKEECGILGCFNGQCKLAVCSSNMECGTDEWVGNLSCQEDDVWQNYIIYTCNDPRTNNSYCSNSTTLELKENCGSDYCEDWGSNYCNLDDVYHNKTCYDMGCSNGVCFNDTYIEEEQVQECGDEGCLNNTCVYVECYEDDECGVNDYVGDSSCQEDDVWQDYITYICDNAATSNSYCSNSTTFDLKEDCGSDYCEDWGSNYCKLSDVYYNKTCYDIGCSNGACFNDAYVEEEKVQECGISEYTGSNYCYGNDVYRDYITRDCSDSDCTSSTSKKKIKDCTKGCIDGKCKIEVCKIVCNFGMCYEYCVWR